MPGCRLARASATQREEQECVRGRANPHFLSGVGSETGGWYGSGRLAGGQPSVFVPTPTFCPVWGQKLEVGTDRGGWRAGNRQCLSRPPHSVRSGGQKLEVGTDQGGWRAGNRQCLCRPPLSVRLGVSNWRLVRIREVDGRATVSSCANPHLLSISPSNQKSYNVNSPLTTSYIAPATATWSGMNGKDRILCTSASNVRSGSSMVRNSSERVSTPLLSRIVW